MILNGNQRGNSKELALHLLKEENELVEVHEIRGFVSHHRAWSLINNEAKPIFNCSGVSR